MIDKSHDGPLTSDEVTAVDAQYAPFPAFRDWPQEPPRVDLWDRAREALGAAAEVSSQEDLTKARAIAMRAAAFDTGAIEGLYSTDRGLTLTVATQAAAWEQKVEERGTDARALFEAQLAAFELVLDHVTRHFPDVTQAWIRRLHEEITGPQDTYVVHTPAGPQEQSVPRGEYKKHPNHVRTEDGGIHAYAPVDHTQSEMQRLIDELASAEFEAAHPLVQASYAHYGLVAIHPFADGNGRVARAVASAYTHRAASVPLLVLAHHREQYFAALAKADIGDLEPFVDFISRVGRDAVALVFETLQTAQAPQPEKLLAEFKDLYLAQEGLTHSQLDQLADRFWEELIAIFSEQVESLSVPDGVDLKVTPGSGGNRGDPPEGFRRMVSPGPRFVGVDLTSASPADASVQLFLDVFVSTSSDAAATVLVQSRGVFAEQLTFGLADLHPALSSAARLRTESFARRLLGRGLKTLLQKAKKRLKRTGY